MNGTPSKWENAPLGEGALIDRTSVRPEDISTGTFYVGLEHIEGTGQFSDVQSVEAGELASNKFAFGENHVLYGKLRPYLRKIALPTFEGICSTDILPLIPGERLDRRFLYYCLRQPKMIELATARCGGANLPRLSPKTLAEFRIPLPPLAEQKRIAAILDKADAIRRKRQDAIALTEEFLRSAFLDMFGDPVTNPKGWEVRPLNQISEVLTGYAFKSKEYVGEGEGVRLCRGANVLPDRLDWSDVGYWKREPNDKLERYELRPLDVVLALDRPWISSGQKIALVKERDLPALLVQRVARIRAPELALQTYLYFALRHPAFARHCCPTETTVPHISPVELRAYPTPLPTSGLLAEFTQLVQQHRALITKLRHQAVQGEALFNSLVQRAFKGEL